eukprot:Sspe_Gene.115914::Locus_104094_Transcript_2_2_Confidence_0.667_Length_1528::g.115914::m.115914
MPSLITPMGLLSPGSARAAADGADIPRVPPTLPVRPLVQELGGGRYVSCAQFVEALTKYRIAFPSNVSREMFEKADKDGDGVLNAEEWEMFEAKYPTLTKCLELRISREKDEQRTRLQIDQLRAEQQSMLTTHSTAVSSLSEARSAVQAVEDRLGEQERVTASSSDRDMAAKGEAEQAKNQVQQVRDELRTRLGDLAKAKDDRMRQQGAMEVVAAGLISVRTEAAKRRATFENAADRLRAIEKLLEEQTREVEAARAGCNEVEEKEQELLAEEAEGARLMEELGCTIEQLQDTVKGLESEAAAREEAMVRTTLAAKEASEHHMKEQGTRSGLQWERERAVAKESEWAAEADKAAGVLRDLERQLMGAEVQLKECTAHRVEIELEEQSMLDQELALARQKDALAEREQSLRAEFSVFSSSQHHHHRPQASRPPGPPSPLHYRSPRTLLSPRVSQRNG